MGRIRSVCGVLLAAGLLAGCSASQVLVPHEIDLVAAGQTVDEEQLLDVAVVVFDPGVPEGDIPKEELEKLLEDGVFVHVRRAESIQMAVQLRNTLQRSGHWGSVWVTPAESRAADINVTAQILESDGYVASVAARAVDATGEVWLDERYEMRTAAAAFDRDRYPGLDPYQDLFNSIANDLAAALARRPAERVERVRTVAALRYAAELSPERFAPYVAERGGVYAPVRLPAADDPLFARTEQVRRREGVFFETLDGHYERLVAAAQPSYDGWRRDAREESITVRELARGARLRTGLGVVAMLGSMLYGGGSELAFARNGMIAVAGELLNMGAAAARSRELHAAALTELSESFDDEVAPMVVEIAGVEHRLTGTAEVQYAELRELLRQLLADETGFEPPPEAEEPALP